MKHTNQTFDTAAIYAKLLHDDTAPQALWDKALVMKERQQPYMNPIQ